MTPQGPIPVVEATLQTRDHLGALRVRWGFGRDHYRVAPGLYALGQPDAQSPVLVSANYKLSFDHLRSALPGRQAWILVLDTDGINVWCAAGKGTFGTDELVRQIRAAKLEQVIEHKKIIVPQLGAPGVAAHLVHQQTGFKVKFGPIRATDIPAFLDANLKATADMRRKTFDLRERVTLIPVDLMAALKIFVPLAIVTPLLVGLALPPFALGLHEHGLPLAQALSIGLVGGCVVTPILLPYLPGRAFALKGLWPGLLGGLGLLSLQGLALIPSWPLVEAGCWLLLAMALSSYLGMVFTGSSTYTSLSGVRREMRLAVPLQLAGAGVASLGLVLSLWMQRGGHV